MKIARLILIKRDCFTEEVYLASYFKKSSQIYTIYFYSIHLVFFACCSFCFCSCCSNIFSRKSCKLGPFLINSSKLRQFDGSLAKDWCRSLCRCYMETTTDACHTSQKDNLTELSVELRLRKSSFRSEFMYQFNDFLIKKENCHISHQVQILIMNTTAFTKSFLLGFIFFDLIPVTLYAQIIMSLDLNDHNKGIEWVE